MKSSRLALGAVALAMVMTVDLGVGSATAVPKTSARQAASQVPTADQATTTDRNRKQLRGRRTWSPRQGVTFNTPGDQSINDKVLKSIRNTRRGEKIRAMTWNFNSWVFTRALRRAHERGVSVRIIMARSLANEQRPGAQYGTLKRALRKGNKRRRPAMRSWFRTCSNSCRGRGGAMHTKMYLFSRVGTQRRVVMSSSANLTGASAKVQFNDMYTITGSKRAYRTSIRVFNQAGRDRPVPAQVYQAGRDFRGWFQPRPGRRDIVMHMLDKVRCHGARGAGINGRTSLRIAQDVILGRRGIRIAKKIRQLDRRGCNIRLVYSQLGGNVWRILQGVPRNHLVADRDGDGAYDIYLHMKAMAISGHYGKRRGARVVYQGSENWSSLASISDEQGLIIDRGRVERRYGRQINRLFRTHLRSARPLPAAQRVADPYMNMEK